MTDSNVQVNPDNASGKKVRTNTVTDDNSETVHQQVMELADEAGSKVAQPIATLIDEDTQPVLPVAGLVDHEARTDYTGGEVRPVSLTPEGRARVEASPAVGEPSYFQDSHKRFYGNGPDFRSGNPWRSL